MKPIRFISLAFIVTAIAIGLGCASAAKSTNGEGECVIVNQPTKNTVSAMSDMSVSVPIVGPILGLIDLMISVHETLSSRDCVQPPATQLPQPPAEKVKTEMGKETAKETVPEGTGK